MVVMVIIRVRVSVRRIVHVAVFMVMGAGLTATEVCSGSAAKASSIASAVLRVIILGVSRAAGPSKPMLPNVG